MARGFNRGGRDSTHHSNLPPLKRWTTRPWPVISVPYSRRGRGAHPPARLSVASLFVGDYHAATEFTRCPE